MTVNKATSPPLTTLNHIETFAALVEGGIVPLKGKMAAAVICHKVPLGHTSHSLVRVVLAKAPSTGGPPSRSSW